MSKIYLALVAAGLLAASSLPGAASGQKAWSGVTNGSVSSEQLSARRYYRRHYRYYRGYYRPYGYDPYYAYGPGPYYYGPRYYSRPVFPFPFFPFY
jgi:hypothetical protein